MKLAAFLGVFALCSSMASAGVILQQEPPGSNGLGSYLAFEAETYDSITGQTGNFGFDADANKSPHGTGAIKVLKTDTPRDIVAYQLKFVVAGTYYLYTRMRSGTTSKGTEHDDFRLLWDDDPTGYPIGEYPNKTDYYWHRKRSAGSQFSVTIAQADVGQVIPMRIWPNETNVFIDRLVFSTLSISDTASNNSKLDGAVNSPIVPAPEPAGALVVGAMLCLALARPRR